MEWFFDVLWPWVWPTLLFFAVLAGLLIGSTRLIKSISDKMNIGGPIVRRATRSVVAAGLLASLFGWARLAPLPWRVDYFLRKDLGPWLWPTLGLLIWLVGGSYATRRLLLWLNVKTQQTKTKLDDALVVALNRPVRWGLAVLGLNLWSGLAPLPNKLQEYITLGTKGAVVLLVVFFLNGIVQVWMALRSESSNLLATSGDVLRAAAKVVIYLVGTLMVLATVGVNVTPLIASLGIGSLAIGLALQKTLEDFFAGLLLAADQPARVGDFVLLESGEEGWVISIGWRTTRMRTRNATHIIVPNSKLAQATLTNRHRPNAEVNFTIPVGVAYDSDLEHVTEVTLKVAHEVQSSDPKGISRFKPRVTFQTFNDSSIDFQVWLRAKTWNDHFGLRSAFIKALHKRYGEEGIEIPFPIRTLDLSSAPPIRVQMQDEALAEVEEESEESAAE